MASIHDSNVLPRFVWSAFVLTLAPAVVARNQV